MSNGLPIPEDHSQDGLTGIPLPIQLAAASGEGEVLTEADEAAVQAFIETLARIAHAVATRTAQQDQVEEKTEQ